jgi:histidinol-phosphate aminotransferase
MLNGNTQTDLLKRGFTRRDLGRAMALITAGASLPFFNEPALAQLSSLGRRISPDAVKINANENPLGPCPAALEALIKVAENGGRYQYYVTLELAELIADIEGLSADNVLPYPGSSLGLHHGVIAFTSPQQDLVTVDPGYEAAASAAGFIGAKVRRIPLIGGSGNHDIPAMLEAGDGAGLFYICNPNNPTGTITPRERIEHLLKNKPSGSVVMLDEAYIHFSDEPWGTDLVKAGEDVIVLRTFSKIYGMAGLRAGYALGRPDLLQKMRSYSAGALPVTAMAAAKASLLDKQVVPVRKRRVGALRSDLLSFMQKHGLQSTPSKSCKFMVDTKRPVEMVIRGMAEEDVLIGRPWPVWPTHARISIGTAEEMEKFKVAFLKVMDRIPENG